MTPSAIAFIAIVLVMGSFVAAAVAHAALRAGRSPNAVVATVVVTTLSIDAWLAVTLGLAWKGVFRRFDALPPRIPILLLTAMALILLLSRTRTFRELNAASPAWWPIALQTFRIPVEIALLMMYRSNLIPVQMTFEGRNFDILVGVSAPIVAWAVANRVVGKGGLLAWNLASLGLLANIVIVANLSAPGPMNAGWPGVSSAILGEPPYIWLPAFLVPLAFFGHVASIRRGTDDLFQVAETRPGS